MKSKFFVTIFILFLLIIPASAGWFYIFAKMSSGRKEILELRKNVMRNDKKTVDEKTLALFLDSVKNEKELIESVFLKEDDLIRLIKGLESIGESSGVSLKISAISTEKGAASKPVISFSAQGEFEQIFKYLYFLENLPYLITIDKVSFQNTEVNSAIAQADNKKTNSTSVWQALFSIKLESYEN